MRTEADRWWGALFHGWVELLTLFGMLLFALLLIGWCWNRGFRPAERGPLVAWPLLLSAYGLVVLLRHFREDIQASMIIAGGLVLAGLLGRGTHPRSLWLPVMMLAALLGQGLNLSAVAFTAVACLVLLFSSGQGR